MVQEDRDKDNCSCCGDSQRSIACDKFAFSPDTGGGDEFFTDPKDEYTVF